MFHLDEVIFAAIGRLREMTHDVESIAFIHLDSSLVVGRRGNALVAESGRTWRDPLTGERYDEVDGALVGPRSVLDNERTP